MNNEMIKQQAIVASLGFNLMQVLKINETKTGTAVADYVLTDALDLFRQGHIGAARRLVTLFNEEIAQHLHPVHLQRYNDFIVFKFA